MQQDKILRYLMLYLSLNRYLVHLHRDFVNFIEHENLRVLQKVVPEVVVEVNPENQVITDDVSTPTVKSAVIEKAREKINGMINNGGYFNPTPKKGKK